MKCDFEAAELIRHFIFLHRNSCVCDCEAANPSQNFGRVFSSNFHFLHGFVTILMDSAILLYGVLPWFWKKSCDTLESIGFDSENEMYHTLAFLAGVMIWSQLTNLPFSLYSTFLIEERHSFNKQTILLFFRDMIKSMFLAVVIGPPVVVAIILIVHKGGPYLAIYLWGFMFVLSLVMMTIYLVLIAPLFNKFTPLPDGMLRSKIENLASSLSFPLKKLFVVDGSTRSIHTCIVLKNYLFFTLH
uniref:CAAX prenyl protease 1 N-terminal domain-containing protein n=1 Tax=Lactuca sativa TaxID=4236 RepID=A0A9R1UQD1_LACSA|nr:hypothetical protein LSAT_V11C800394800 [Lactuca sativa]